MTLLLLPFLLFFLSVTTPCHQPICHISGVYKPSALSMAWLKMSLRMFAQLWKQGPLQGHVLVLSAGKCSRPTDDWDRFVLSCRSPHHPASIGGSFCVRTNFLRLHEVLKQLGTKPNQNRLGQLSGTVEGTYARLRSLGSERLLRTKWRKAFPSHLQLSSGPKHHTKPQEE